MNGIITAIRFVTYTLGGLAIRKCWNWLNTDVDPIPFTKEFDEEYTQIKAKYIRLTRKKEEYEAYRKSRRTIS